MRALLAVGVEEYDDSAIADLHFARSDADAFASIGIERFGVEPELAVVLNGEASTGGKVRHPTRSRLLQALGELIDFSKRQHLEAFYFFFSGHGLHARDSGREYLLTSDTVAAVVEDTALSFEHIERLLRKLDCTHRVLFVDACRSRVSPSKNLQPEDRLDVRHLRPEGMVTFCSCHPGTASYEAPELGHGVFTHTLLRAFSEEVSCASVDDVDRYLEEQMPLACRQVGLPEQRPYTQVEPLQLRELVLVSDHYLRQRHRSTRLGRELRVSAVTPFSRLDEIPANLIAAVDFGTSYSAIAVCLADGEPVLIPSPEGRRIIPSVLRVDSQRDYSVGWAAQWGRGGVLIEHPKRALVDNHMLDLAGEALDPVVASSLVLRSLRRNAEEFLQRPVVKAVIGIPADFSSAVRQRIFSAFELAGYEIRRDVTEPSAVAMATIRDDELDFGPAGSEVLVLDLGGGTFDAATIAAGTGEDRSLIEIRGGSGDQRLGGIDFDLALAQVLQTRLLEAAKLRRLSMGELDAAELRRKAEELKRFLGAAPVATVVWPDVPDEVGNLSDLFVSISREDCAPALKGLLDRLTELIKRAVDPDEPPKCVVLGGQGGKIWTVREQVAREFPGIPIVDRYQESAVALGLARQAGILSGVNPTRALLLEMNFWGIGVYFDKYEEDIEDISRLEFMPKIKVISINVDGIKNSQRFTLLNPVTTIPTLQRAVLSLQVDNNNSLSLPLFAISPRNEWQELGIIEMDHSWCSKIATLFITVDVDADRVMHLHLGEPLGFSIPPEFDPQKTASFVVDAWRHCSQDADHTGEVEVDLPAGHPRSKELTLVGGFGGRWRRLRTRTQ